MSSGKAAALLSSLSTPTEDRQAFRGAALSTHTPAEHSHTGFLEPKHGQWEAALAEVTWLPESTRTSPTPPAVQFPATGGATPVPLFLESPS